MAAASKKTFLLTFYLIVIYFACFLFSLVRCTHSQHVQSSIPSASAASRLDGDFASSSHSPSLRLYVPTIQHNIFPFPSSISISSIFFFYYFSSLSLFPFWQLIFDLISVKRTRSELSFFPFIRITMIHEMLEWDS